MKTLKKAISGVPMKKLMYNRGVLYALCILALFNLIMYANARDFNSVITLIIVGLLVSFFSKNMIVVLAVAIGVTYLLNYTSVKLISEGAENMKKEGEDAGEDAGEKTGEDAGEKSDVEIAEDAEKKKMYDALQTDFQDFQKIQDSILTGMKEIDPLLTKAETFIEKFEHYGKKLEKSA